MKILLIEDHAMVAQGLMRILAAGGHEPVGFARNGEEAAKLLLQKAPELVLLDLSLPGKTGLEVLSEILRMWPTLRVIILTMWDDPYCRERARHLGAKGYITKDAGQSVLLEGISVVANGGEWFPVPPPSLSGETSKLDPQLHVSSRQHEVLSLVAHGMGYKGAASALGRSNAAIDGHIRRLHKLFGVTTNPELVRKAMEHGILEA